MASTTLSQQTMALRSSLNLLQTNLTTHTAKLLIKLYTLLNHFRRVIHVRWTAVRVWRALSANNAVNAVFFSRPRITFRL